MSLDVVAIVIGLAGGLALFLFGMEQLSDGLQKVAGSTVRNLLGRLTRNRFVGAVTGAVVTAVIQSSSVTTVLIVGFISAGLMTMRSSIALILGADVGTTFTVQILAFKVANYGLVLIAAGFVLPFLYRGDRGRHWGSALMGLGMIFFGMEVMSQATGPLRSYEPFIDWMAKMEAPALGIAAAAVFTAIIQSSAATIGIVIVLASQGFVTLEAGVALVFGSNIGTCATALLAAIGKPREAVRAAAVHIIFKVVGVLIWLPFIHELVEATRFVSPSSPELTGLARLSAEMPRQIANAHTLFNLINAFVFIWFVTPFAWLVEKLIPVKPDVEKPGRPIYLDRLVLSSPDLALDRTRLELGRMGTFAVQMVQKLGQARSEDALQDLRRMDETIDSLHVAIIGYLSELSRRDLTEGQSDKVAEHLAVANYLEGIGDLVETGLVEAAAHLYEVPDLPSEQTAEMLADLASNVASSLSDAVAAFGDENEELAEEVIGRKESINEMVAKLEERLATRLAADAPRRLDAFRNESQIVENLKRVYYFAKRIAKIGVQSPID